MPVTEDIESSTQPIKGRKKMKKSKMAKSGDGFKKFTPNKNKGSAKYRKQIIKGKSKNSGGVGQGAKYGGA